MNWGLTLCFGSHPWHNNLFMHLLIVLFSLLLASISQPGKKHAQTQQETECAKQKIPCIVPVVSEWLSSFYIEAPTGNADQTNPYNASTDCLYRMYLIATIMGVVVAIVGGTFLVRQTIATEQLLRLSHRPR